MDLRFAQNCQGRRPQRQPIAFKFKVSLLLRPNPVWKPAQLEAMNDKTLLFVDLVGAAVADVSLEAALDLLRCGLGQVVGAKVRAIRTHESSAHLSSRIVHDAPKSIWSQGRIGQITVGFAERLDWRRREHSPDPSSPTHRPRRQPSCGSKASSRKRTRRSRTWGRPMKRPAATRSSWPEQPMSAHGTARHVALRPPMVAFGLKRTLVSRPAGRIYEFTP